MDYQSTPKRHSSSLLSLLALAALLLGGIPAAWATHASDKVSCVYPNSSASWSLTTPWATPGSNPGSVAVGQPINRAVLKITWLVQKHSANQAQLSVHANWTDYAKWNSTHNAMRFRELGGDARGFGLRITDSFGKVLKANSADPVFSHIVFDGVKDLRLYYPSHLVLDVLKLDDVTTSGTLSYFGAGFAFKPMYLKSGAGGWVPIEGCATNQGFISFGDLGVDAPPPPPPPTVACTFNQGNPINIRLPQVYTGNLASIGQVPTGGYPKAVFPLRYSCTTTGGATNPNYTIRLDGTAAGNGSNALASNKTNLGVKVETVSSRGGTSVVMVPNTTETALYDSGVAGGSTLQLISYPVRTQTGTIAPGEYQAEATLQVFSR